MKTLYLLIIFYIGLSLSGCATPNKSESAKNAKTTQTALAQPQTATTKEKNPLNVAVYNEGSKPANNYKVLGTETISKFNYGGIKRQIASIHDAMRNLAAKMGGDAIINVAHDDKSVTGTVITYQDSSKPKTAA